MAADDAAEAALSVQRTYQNRGVGTELLRRLIVLARNRSIRSLHMLCLLENGKVLHIARKLGAKLTFDHSEVEGWLALPGPNRLTLLLELLDDTSTVLASLRPVGRALQRQMRRSGNPRDSKPRSDGKTNLGCVHRPRFVLDGRYAKGQRGERGSGACRRARIRAPAPRHQDAVRLAQLGDGMPSEAPTTNAPLLHEPRALDWGPADGRPLAPDRGHADSGAARVESAGPPGSGASGPPARGGAGGRGPLAAGEGAERASMQSQQERPFKATAAPAPCP